MKAPEQSRVAVRFADETVGIMQFVTREYAPDDTTRWARVCNDATVREELSRTQFETPVTGFRIMEPDEPVPDADFRNAWKDTGAITVDMPRARELHRQRLRVMRKPLLADLDVEYAKADEAGDQQEKKRIAQKKQALRDVTADPRIDAAQTTADLKAAVPEVLR